MQKFNIHTHTRRCGHAVGLDQQYIEAAIQGKFNMIGMSDHIPYKGVYKPNDRMKFEEVEEYINHINELKIKYQESIEVKVGFECEYIEDREQELFDMYERSDYLILGQHCKYLDYEYDYYTSDEDVIKYVDAIEKALSKGIFTYLAHPDYIMIGRRSYDKVCEEAAHRIANACIKYDVPVEVNLKCIQTGEKNKYFNSVTNTYITSYPYPFRPFWEILAQYNCKVVFGYDAHIPLSLLERYKEDIAKEVLSGLNLNYINTIELK